MMSISTYVEQEDNLMYSTFVHGVNGQIVVIDCVYDNPYCN